MLKNTAGQAIGAQMLNVLDGLEFTGAVTIYVTGDRGTQAVGSVGSGACTHEGKGFHSYAPAQAETNYDHIAWTFEGTGAITVTVQVFTTIATPTVAEIADAVWDEVLTGATHNVATSAGRRLRGVQDNAAYDDGAIWVDTVNGSAGTTVYENGTSGNPVSTLSDALTLAAAANVRHLHIVNGSTITLTSSVSNFELTGDEWGIAFGGQNADQASIHNAHLPGVGVSGTFSGNVHLLHSTIGAITGPNARVGWCALTGAITSNGTGTWVIHSSWGLSGAQFDFGAGGAQTVYITDWLGGPITIAGMLTGDVLYFEGRSALLTLAASCTGGTVYLAGDIALTNSGSGQTINQTSRYEITRILSDSTAFAGDNVATAATQSTTAATQSTAAAASAANAVVEIAKIHKSGETRRYTQIAADDVNKTADVSVGDAL